MSLEIKQLSRENANLLDRVAPDVFDGPVVTGALEQFIEDPRHVMFLAVESGTTVGMASAVEYFHPDKRPQLWINEVGVAATHRRRGIGRRLVGALLEHGKTLGCVSAWLGTDIANHAARGCFGSVGTPAEPAPFLLYEWDLV